MIPACHPRLVPSTPSPFNEGASSTSNKVTVFVLSLFASLATFFFLPIEGALAVSAGVVALCSMFFCCSGSNGGESGRQISRRQSSDEPWYSRFFSSFFTPSRHIQGGRLSSARPDYTPYPSGAVHGHPVRNAGSRPEVGGGSHRRSSARPDYTPYPSENVRGHPVFTPGHRTVQGSGQRRNPFEGAFTSQRRQR